MKPKISDYPLVISFYSGEKYYYDAAKKIIHDCESLGLNHHIIEIKNSEEYSWIDLCRHKVIFIKKCMELFDRSLLWIDVDCRILGLPEILKNSAADFGAFLRGFKYIRDFDPLEHSGLFQPSVLFFRNSSVTKTYLDLVASIASSDGSIATDDYFLQEAWKRFKEQMSIILFPPSMVAFELPAKNDEVFYFGRSGSASRFKDECAQHKPKLYQEERCFSVLNHEAEILLNEKSLEGAILLLKRALRYSNDDASLACRIANLMRKKGDLDEGLLFLQEFQAQDESDTDFANRYLLDSYLISNRLDRAQEIALKLEKEGSLEDKRWAQSRLIRISMSQRARSNNVKKSERIKLWWMQGPYPGNFGDIINPYIIEKLTGAPPIFSSHKTSLIAIGSTIKFAGPKSQIWGAGTPRMSDRLCPEASYHAVRGPLTRQLVIESGGDCPEVYGDPAVFLPNIYKPKASKQKYKLGIVRHYTNNDELVLSAGVKDIPVLRVGYKGIEEFIDEINQCERIISTSLHGLIVSHAYGIPARWCQIVDASEDIPGDGTKYRDYLKSVGISNLEPIRLTKETIIYEKMSSSINQLPERYINLRNLIEAAPFKDSISIETI